MLGIVACGDGAEVDLTLEERASVPLPSGVEPSHIITGRNGAIAVQAPQGLFWIEGPDVAPHYVGSLDLLDVVGLALEHDGLEAVDANTRRLVHLDRDGSVIRWMSLSTATTIESATRTDCGWAVSGSNLAGSRISGLGDDGEVAWDLETPLKSPRLTSQGHQLVATEPQRPFRIHRLDCRAPSDGTIYDHEPVGTGGPSWRSLPAFPLGILVIRTIADLSSDDRRMEVFNEGGLLRSRRLMAPIGLVASVCEGGIMAVRTIAESEIVVYAVRTGIDTRPDPSNPGDSECVWGLTTPTLDGG